MNYGLLCKISAFNVNLKTDDSASRNIELFQTLKAAMLIPAVFMKVGRPPFLSSL
jgi:hypothetical protein